MHAVPVGAHAVLIECADLDEVRAVAAAAWRRRASAALAVEDIVPAARTVLLDGVDDAAGLARSLGAWAITPEPAGAAGRVELPVRFDGADLAEVADHWNVSPSEVAEIMCAADLEVAFCGFSPGFAYLTGLGREVPRRAVPRTSVPAGSVGLAGGYAGVYPSASPGGWQLVGTAVGVRVWDPTREPPALLAPGTAVRFVEAR